LHKSPFYPKFTEISKFTFFRRLLQIKLEVRSNPLYSIYTMKITIEFDDTKDDFKAECFEAIRIMDVAKENILMTLSRPSSVQSQDAISSWLNEIDVDSGIRSVCVFNINL
jgi:hypothetical protein